MSDTPRATPAVLQITGIALFLFIPVVLFLFVRHPEPIAASLAAGVLLMLGHRFLARPYFVRVRGAKCIWCNRWIEGTARAADAEAIEVAAGAERVRFAACAGHAEPARRFFAWVDRLRLPLRAGIGLPLVALLVALGFAAAGRALSGLPVSTEVFRFVVGLTVHLAAIGPFVAAPASSAPPRAAFPLHNFSLLGASAILWIFRLVGIWWIVAGGRALAALL
jgi:hypothetical protein